MQRKSGLTSFILSFILTQCLVLSPVLAKSSKISSKTSTESYAFSTEILQGPYSSWGVDKDQKGSINLLKAWQKFKKKKEIVVAVIDTGIDYNHPYLKDNIIASSGSVSEKNYGMDFSKSVKSGMEKTPNDSHGHGTHVAGIIKTAFPDVKLLALKYYDPKASGQENLNSTIKALEYAVEANVDVINYSGGGPEPSDEELEMLKKAEKKGILVVAAAGNEKSNIDDQKNAYYPASYGLSNIITVMAHDQSVEKIASSNFGAKSVDISAPGYRIRSSIPAQGSAKEGKAGYMTGTSQATAFASGVAALIKAANPNLSAKEIKAIIINSADKDNSSFKKINLSGGRLDALAALKEATHDNEKAPSQRKVANNVVHTIIYGTKNIRKSSSKK